MKRKYYWESGYPHCIFIVLLAVIAGYVYVFTLPNVNYPGVIFTMPVLIGVNVYSFVHFVRQRVIFLQEVIHVKRPP